MKKTLTTFAMIGFAMLLGSCKPEISNQTKLALEKIGFDYEPGHVGNSGEESGQPKHILALNAVASWDELTYIEAADSVPMHRLAAFICILKRNPKYAKYLAISKICELNGLDFVRGCEGRFESISACRVAIMQEGRKEYGLSVEDSIEVDDALLRAPLNKHIYYSNRLMEKLPPHPKYYSRLKELFFKEHKLEALRALARYHNPELYPIILKAAEGIVDNPIDLQAYDKELERQDKGRTPIEKFRDFLYGPYTEEFLALMAAEKQYGNDIYSTYSFREAPFDEWYNYPEEVKKMALKCIYENPSPAFAKYQKEAEEYHKKIHEYYW